MRLEYSTTSPTSGYTNLPATGLPYAGTGGPANIQLNLPADFDERPTPIYLRWFYKRGTGNQNGRGLSLDNVTLTYSTRILNVDLGEDIVACAPEIPTLTAQAFDNATYSWSTGANTRSITATTDGTYIVNVTAPGGRFGADTINVDLRPSPFGSAIDTTAQFTGASGGNGDSLCLGEVLEYEVTTPAPYTSANYGSAWEIQNLTVRRAGSNTNISGSVSLLPPTVSTPARIRISPTRADGNRRFRVALRVVDLNSDCPVSLERFFQLYPEPVTGLRPDTTFCSGSTSRLFANPGFSSYLWNDGSTNPFLDVDSAGQYWLEVVSTEGCTKRDSFRLQVSRITNVLPNDTTACGSVTLNAGNPTSRVAWSNGSLSRVVNLTSSGQYVVVYETNVGCLIQDTVNVVILPDPQGQLPARVDLCAGQTALLDSRYSGPASLSWFRNDTGLLASGPILPVTQAGTYRLTLTQGNCTNSVTTQVVVNPLPTVTLPADVVACNRYFLRPATTGNNLTYAWSNGATTREQVVDYSGLFSLTVIDGNGCIDIDTQRVTIIPPQVLRIEGPSLAGAESFVDFTAQNSGGAVFSWRWDFGNGEFSFLPENVYTWYDSPGIYTVRLVTNTANCGFDTLFHTIVISEATARAQQLDENALRLSPNPSTGPVQAELATPLQTEGHWQLLNLQGQIIQTGHWPAGVREMGLDVAALSSGMYALRMVWPGANLRAERKLMRP
jgi:PKD repeat protein